jgi:methylmalonyl-CoA/ethylmalonyl-CoA epimerase
MTLGLGYVALALREPARGERLFGEDLGLPRGEMRVGAESFPVFRAGAAALALFPSGHPFLTGRVAVGVDHLGLTAVDPDAVPLAGAPRPGPGGAAQRHADPIDTVGVCLRVSAPLAFGFAHGASPWIKRIDHLGIASVDNAAAEAIHVGRLGLPFESRQTDIEVRTAVESFTSDKYGVVFHQRTPELAGGLRVSFVTLGDCELEFLQDFDPAMGAQVDHGAAGTTKQDQGAIGRFVARHGPGLHHVALKTPDMAHLAARGHRLIDRTGRPGSRRGRIGFLHPATTGGVLVHFVERHDPDRD